MKRSAYPLSARCYFAGRKLVDNLYALATICYSGFWLGILKKDTIDSLAGIHYDRKESYVSDDYTRSGLYDWEEEAIRQYFADCRTVHVVAAGGGREVLALRKLGYDADGCDCNLRLVQYANDLLGKEDMPACIHLSPPDSCSDMSREYDGAVIGWGAYTHIQTRRSRVDLLRQLHAHLRDGAPVLVSFWIGSRDRRQILTVRIANIIRRVRMREPVAEGDSLTRFFAHLFVESEIRSELAEAGFETVFYDTGNHPRAIGIVSK